MNLRQKKSVQAINYFARMSEGNEINRVKLMKLLWLSDRLHMRRHGRMILSDNYFAIKKGPIPSKTLDLSRNKEHDYVSSYFIPDGYNVISKNESDLNFFSASEIEVMNKVWKEFGHFSRFDLSEISHKYPEWKKFEEQINTTGSRFLIQSEDFFEIPENLEDSFFSFFESHSPNPEIAKEIFDRKSIFSDSNY